MRYFIPILLALLLLVNLSVEDSSLHDKIQKFRRTCSWKLCRRPVRFLTILFKKFISHTSSIKINSNCKSFKVIEGKIKYVKYWWKTISFQLSLRKGGVFAPYRNRPRCCRIFERFRNGYYKPPRMVDRIWNNSWQIWKNFWVFGIKNAVKVTSWSFIESYLEYFFYQSVGLIRVNIDCRHCL